MIEIICKIILCHLFGDYVLQCDYIAKSKGDNWYHLFVHCALYTLPFCFCFGYNIGALVIFISHRLGFARMADNIIVFNNGKVEEVGNHEELMEQSGLYKQMFEVQKEMYF